ncbi:hypothetical protein DTO027B5_4669 [Paecilomyces variotii]|nr:hypothetical protein DTO027B3_2083 [Paecilomyces variotii]KAJ9333485.1 hypothetical protein DTO027B5_4669 [Paecilomyces variotii]
MESGSIQEVDVAIIGAGWYGLVTARTYLRLCPNANLIIIDSDSTVGGVWSEDRLYPNLVAQVNLGLFNYTDTPMPADGVNKEGQVTGRMIHNYLQRYAEDHDLLRRVRFNTFVEKVERRPQNSGAGWRLHFHQTTDMVDTAKLLVATGVTSIPNMPSYRADDVSIPVIHSKNLGASFKGLQNSGVKRVIVVGSAKSAYDAVYLLLKMGKQVTWVIRPGGAGPLAILPSKLLGFWSSIGVASTRLMTGLSPSIFNTQGLLYSLLQGNPLGRRITSLFWDVVTFLSDLHAGYHLGGHVANLRPEIKGKSIFWANSGLGVVTLPDFWSTIRQGDVTVVRDDLDTITENKLVLASGSVIQAEFVIMCTGWGDHFGMFDDSTKNELGLPRPVSTSVSNGKESTQEAAFWTTADTRAEDSVSGKLPFLLQTPAVRNGKNFDHPQRKWRLYRRVVPMALAEKGDRSLAVLGQIHTVQTPLVAEIQSFWAILYLLGKIELPSRDSMAREIAEWNVWTKRRYLSQGQKFPYSLYDFLPYIDTLCRDLGINSRRKKNPIAEIFSPYRPEDFNGFVDEYLAAQNGGAGKRYQKSDDGWTRAFFGIGLGIISLLLAVNWMPLSDKFVGV